MAISHHDREEETLIAYFRQMLAEVDDEEFAGELHVADDDSARAAGVKHDAADARRVMESANAAIAEQLSGGVAGDIERLSTNDMLSREIGMADEVEEIDNPLSRGYEMQRQQAAVADQREFAEPEQQGSLQKLLESVPLHAETAVAVESVVESKAAEPVVETAVAEPVVETKVAEPVVETKVAEPAVETKVAEPVVETKVAEPVVETKVAEPAVETKVAEPAVETKVVQRSFKSREEMQQFRMAEQIRSINSEWQNVDLGENFQALFFQSQGVRFAVPLIDLGGIFECDKITQLFGKPDWFMGITDVRGMKINIVDTLRWVMPEIGESPDSYPYLIALGNSKWSIGCDVLEGNRSLTRDQVKWREIPGSRPWLAGIVTTDKCALLHVQALISLFDAGAGIDDLSADETEKSAD